MSLFPSPHGPALCVLWRAFFCKILTAERLTAEITKITGFKKSITHLLRS
jgi:hypothetical protein